MKKRIFAFILSIAAVESAFAVPHRFYSLKAKIPTSLKNEMENLPAYYKGHKVDLIQGWTSLPECAEPCTFSLLVTENVDFVAKGNNVRYLKRKKDQEYAWYDFTLSFHNEKEDDQDDEHKDKKTTPQKTYSWNIEQHEESESPERIPEHTVVLLTNPEFIAKVEAEPALPGALDIVLPTIIFKDSLDPEVVKESSLNVLMGPMLDLDAIHRKDNPSCMARKDTVVISAAQKNYETR